MAEAADRYTPFMVQWGIPDPRQAGSYPGDETSFTQWAWEFLRRRDDYRAQWLETIAPHLGADGEFDEAAWYRAMQQGRMRAVTARQPYSIVNPIEALARNFGIGSLGGVDPRHSGPQYFDGRSISVHSWLSEKKMSEWAQTPEWAQLPKWARRVEPMPLEEYECSVTINVAFPLKAQFRLAEKILQGLVQQVPLERLIRSSKPQTNKFVRYLRVLDFETMAEVDGVIGEHLFPHIDFEQRRVQLRDSRTAAKDWQRGYMRLVMANEG